MSFRIKSAQLVIAIAVLVASAASGHAQVYVESFDGARPSIMLNGVLQFGSNGPWSTRIANGALEMENRTADDALRYYKVERVIYPGSSTPVATEDATIETTVGVSGEERSGAGILARYDAKTQDYLLFAIGPLATFHVIQRKAGKARYVAAGASAAIQLGVPNRLLVKTLGSTVVFDVNGHEVVRMPGDETPGRLVGIGAFGRGTFTFHEVRIAPPGVDTSAAHSRPE